jgi:hypothetical protein
MSDCTTGMKYNGEETDEEILSKSLFLETVSGIRRAILESSLLYYVFCLLLSFSPFLCSCLLSPVCCLLPPCTSF